MRSEQKRELIIELAPGSKFIQARRPHCEATVTDKSWMHNPPKHCSYFANVKIGERFLCLMHARKILEQSHNKEEGK